jgi:2-amino-4-hydroxy-6-hydroxymethyldihydropteridine diphosphokinase
MTEQRYPVCLLLGSNIQPERNIALAIDRLRKMAQIIQISSVWETPSVGFAGPNFLNLAVVISTPLEAGELKEQVLRPLEAELGRVRTADKNSPRTMDLDIILFDGQLLDPNLWRFAHLAVPVAEIMPNYRSSQGESLSQVALRLAETARIDLRPDVSTDRSA